MGILYKFQCYKQKKNSLFILNCVTVVLLNHVAYDLDRAFFFFFLDKLLNICYVVLCPNSDNRVLC